MVNAASKDFFLKKLDRSDESECYACVFSVVCSAISRYRNWSWNCGAISVLEQILST